jgi:hypothetical protein
MRDGGWMGDVRRWATMCNVRYERAVWVGVGFVFVGILQQRMQLRLPLPTL